MDDFAVSDSIDEIFVQGCYEKCHENPSKYRKSPPWFVDSFAS